MALELSLHHIDEGGVREAVLDGEMTPRDTPAFLLRVPPSLQPCRSLPFAMLAGWPTPLRTTPRTSNGSEKLRPVACRMAAAVAAWGLVLVWGGLQQVLHVVVVTEALPPRQVQRD